MNKKLMKYCGSLQQLVYARPVTYKEGRAEHMNAIEAKCGDIFFHSAADKALDITDLTYKGMNMTFLAKPGLEGRNQYDTNGQDDVENGEGRTIVFDGTPTDAVAFYNDLIRAKFEAARAQS